MNPFGVYFYGNDQHNSYFIAACQCFNRLCSIQFSSVVGVGWGCLVGLISSVVKKQKKENRNKEINPVSKSRMSLLHLQQSWLVLCMGAQIKSPERLLRQAWLNRNTVACPHGRYNHLSERIIK